MKKWVVVVILAVVLGSPPAALIGGEFHGKAEVGYLMERGAFVTGLELGYLVGSRNGLYADASVGIEVVSEFMGITEDGSHRPAWAPFQDSYDVHLTMGYRFVYVEWFHRCTHPVWSSVDQFEQNFFGENLTTLTAGVEFCIPIAK